VTPEERAKLDAALAALDDMILDAALVPELKFNVSVDATGFIAEIASFRAHFQKHFQDFIKEQIREGLVEIMAKGKQP